MDIEIDGALEIVETAMVSLKQDLPQANVCPEEKRVTL